MPRPASRPIPPSSRKQITAPAWFRPALLVLSCLILTGLFSREISNSDFWWQLKSGQYIWQTHSLPDPDPFAYTTAAAGHAYPGEEITRHFNLTHEWLAQVLLYLTYSVAGFGGIVLGRTALLIAFCALAGWIAYRRCGGFYRALAATFAAAAVADPFVADRPFLVTFVLLALTIAILEWRKPAVLWLLPFMMLVWANCHGGFVLGWVVMAAYSAEALFLRLRGRPQADDRRLWIVCSVSALAAGLNPNGFQVVPVLLKYRQSFLTANLLEWTPPSIWPPSAFSILLVIAAVVLLWKYRNVRVADWLLFVAFSAAALLALRNIFLIGLLAPILIATYLPWRRTLNIYAEIAAAVLLLAGSCVVLARGQGFQLRAADWALPEGAADFLISHHIHQRMFNTYEDGGYLMWRLWPQERVFIDGRALSESVFADYRNILYNSDGSDGKNAPQLLEQYGVEVVVINTFDHASGQAHLLAPSLADPDNKDWSMVYADPQAVVFLRHPPPGTPILDSSQILNVMESECDLHIQHEPQFPGCARNLGQMFSNTGDFSQARRWLGVYLEHAPVKDPEAENAFQSMMNAGN